ncbi:YeeE/YedE family protein [Mesorhizobium sp. B1-1-8]|uniref:YeeE/YedE family protein n=1 Tax=Mesorhizobium sp. B1-1-8 TaxID=2589976 RepID=UPI00112D0618|nr:YeeE/YedE family protein [Mesorhizobium sp. B1-1-8]UCI06793.1 YeeE/YedE family protein [Mesorhizobium sp. B1-1-8]
MTSYLVSLLGGALIGLSSAMLLILNGKIAGISGIVGRLVQGIDAWTNAAFVVGLLLGPVVYIGAFHHRPPVTMTASLPLIMIAGLLVGFGSRMGSGCTSGHGVMGLARLSPRSIVAVLTFVASGVLAVALLHGTVL